MRGDSHKVTEVRQSLKLLPAPILTVVFFPRDSAISYQADLGFFQGQKLGMTSHCPPPKHITFSSVLPVLGYIISAGGVCRAAWCSVESSAAGERASKVCAGVRRPLPWGSGQRGQDLSTHFLGPDIRTELLKQET